MAERDYPMSKVSLTDREREILRLLTSGLTDSEIAEAVILTIGTVKWYNRQIYNKLGVRNRAEAITRAQRLGLLDAAARQPMTTAPTHNLPAQITSFIGRSRELAELRAALLVSRLITMTGPPGTGKTRLLRLSSRLEALGEGARSACPPAHAARTLAWSYDLLTPDEQSLFTCLGVFVGGFSPADVEAVCADGLTVVSGLESLLNKSLLRQTQSTNAEPRFMMLGAAAALRSSIHSAIDPTDQPEHERYMAQPASPA